jgi:phosphotransferase system  glucose/maltose/N-acetylglucosamine-specific IIC component
LFKLADKLQYGLYTEAQAQGAGINVDDFRAMQASYNNARNLFVNTLKGKEDKFKQAITKGVKKRAINGLGELGELGAATASLITAALGFITSVLGMFKGKKNPATGETFADENVTEGQVRDLLNEAEGYDEDGYPVNTTAQPAAEENFWQKAGNFANNMVSTASNLVSNYLPSGGGGGGGASVVPYAQTDDDYTDYETVNQQDMIISPASGNSSAVTANVMSGGMMANIGNFVKKNAVMLGIGAMGVAGAVYFLTRKKKRSKGLSGISRRKTVKRRTTKAKRLKPINLS